MACGGIRGMHKSQHIYDLHLSDTHMYICVACVFLTMTNGFILSRSSITLNAHKICGSCPPFSKLH